MKLTAIVLLPVAVVVFFIAGLLGRPVAFFAASAAAAAWTVLVVTEGRKNYSELTADIIARHEEDPDD